MAEFPPTGCFEDAAKFSDEIENTSIGTDMEGQYRYQRPRSTRKPRYTFTTGFTDLTPSQRTLIEQFWNAHQGKTFTYKSPATGIDYVVHFQAGQKLRFEYQGLGPTRRYGISGLVLEQQ